LFAGCGDAKIKMRKLNVIGNECVIKLFIGPTLVACLEDRERALLSDFVGQ